MEIILVSHYKYHYKYHYVYYKHVYKSKGPASDYNRRQHPPLVPNAASFPSLIDL